MNPEPNPPAASQQPVVSVKDLSRALADPTRWRLLWELGQGEALPVMELARRVGRPASLISKHLGILRKAGLVVIGYYGRLYQYAPALRYVPGARTVDLGQCVMKLDVWG